MRLDYFIITQIFRGRAWNHYDTDTMPCLAVLNIIVPFCTVVVSVSCRSRFVTCSNRRDAARVNIHISAS